MQFDPRAAKLLKVGQHINIKGCLGLRIERTPAGVNWVWRYRSPVDGKAKRMKLGQWPEMSAGDALSKWEKLRAARSAGESPAEVRRKPAPVVADPLVSDLIDGFVAQAKRAPKGLAELSRTLGMDAAKIRALRASQVARAVAYDLIDSKRDTPVQASSLRRELGAVWEWAHDSGRLPETCANWWRLILRGKLQSKGKVVGGKHQGVVKRSLSLDEVRAVLRMLPGISRLPADLIMLYLFTGCRGSELVQMEGSELREEGSTLWWLLPREKTKMARHPLAEDMWVPLLGPAREVALRRLEMHGSGHLFPPATGRALHVDQKVVGVAVHWHRPTTTLRPESVRVRWPIENFSPHDLRRAVRTHLSRLGCPADVAEAVLGHIKGGVEGVYDRHDYKPERLHWLSRLAAEWVGPADR